MGRDNKAGESCDRRIDQACLWHDQAVVLRERGRLKRADLLGRKALALLEQECGRHHPDVANVLNHLGSVQSDLGHYARAQALFNRSVAIMDDLRSNAGDENLARLRVQSLSHLGTTWRLQGRFRQAQRALSRALKLAQDSLPANDPDIAMALNNLGVLFKYQNRFS